MQDGTKVHAKARANSFTKEERIRQHLDLARQHVQAMGQPDREPPADRRAQTRARAARERLEKLARALQEVQKLRAAKMEDKRGYEPKVNTTDPESRIMKTSEGGYAGSSCIRDKRMVGCSRKKPCARTISQRSRNLHDPRWFRVHPAQACLRGGETMPIRFRETNLSARPPPQVCAYDSAGHQRSAQGVALARAFKHTNYRDLHSGRSLGEVGSSGIDHRAQVAYWTLQGDRSVDRPC